jgi:hypothetical protein
MMNFGGAPPHIRPSQLGSLRLPPPSEQNPQTVAVSVEKVCEADHRRTGRNFVKPLKFNVFVRFDEFQGEHHPMSVMSVLLAARNFDALEIMRISAHKL